MRKIIMLAFSNMRKTKGNTICLLSMFLISALLLNAGLLLFINFGNFFQKLTEELNASDMYYFIPSTNYTKEVEDLFKKDDNVLEYEKIDAMRIQGTEIYKGEVHEQVFIVSNVETKRNMSKWKFIGRHLPDDDMSVYLPNIYHIDGGYDLDDKFTIKLADKELTFTIKGFTEDVFFSSLDTGFMGVYLPKETYEKVSQEIDDKFNTAVVFANLKEVNKKIESKVKEISGVDSSYVVTNIELSIFSRDLPIVELSRILMSRGVSSMIVAFAVVITVVCLIVVRYRIKNSIEEDMTKIGSLKALGYTSKQIILSVIIQFVLIAFVGSVLGISLSYASVPVLSDVFAQQSGLIWVQGFDIVISSIALFFILIIVVISSYLSARRINKLNPITALRGGIITHSFQKNRVPLSKSKGDLSVNLAFKLLLQNIKQSIMISFIIFAVTCAGAFAVIMFYNTIIDTTTFKKTPGIELCNAVAYFKTDIDGESLSQSISNMDGVVKVFFNDDVMVNIDGNEILAYLCDDYSLKETNTVYEGRYPLHDNEIVLAGHLANILDKKVGDTVTIKNYEYIVTGLSQGSNLGGMNASLRYDGYYKINPGFIKSKLNIYLSKGEDAALFVEQLKHKYGHMLETSIDMDKFMSLALDMYTTIVSKVGIVIFVVTMSVIVLVLYFVINSTFIRKKREFGIQKAIGFTTLQLMNQVSISFLFPVIAGVIPGCIVGMTQTNTLLSVVQRSMGIMKAEYIIQPMWIAIFGVIVLIVSYITSMLVSLGIHKVSAYNLVSE